MPHNDSEETKAAGKNTVTFRTGGVVSRIDASRRKASVIPRGHFVETKLAVEEIKVGIQTKDPATNEFSGLDEETITIKPE